MVSAEGKYAVNQRRGQSVCHGERPTIFPRQFRNLALGFLLELYDFGGGCGHVARYRGFYRCPQRSMLVATRVFTWRGRRPIATSNEVNWCRLLSRTVVIIRRTDTLAFSPSPFRGLLEEK